MTEDKGIPRSPHIMRARSEIFSAGSNLRAVPRLHCLGEKGTLSAADDLGLANVSRCAWGRGKSPPTPHLNMEILNNHGILRQRGDGGSWD